MKRIALVKNDKVQNVIMAENEFLPPKGILAIETDTASVGDAYDGSNFIENKPEFTREFLIKYAKNSRENALYIGVKFKLGDRTLQVPADASTCRDLDALFLASKNAASLVVGDSIVKLSPKQIAKIKDAVFEHIVRSYAILAQLVEEINDNKISSINEIDSPNPSWLESCPIVL